ncbi:hypothetical protein IHQ71_12010 [Rhizobium sp. TH2]|uniref:hypothetical protein n=1 Tax=Rhizobium sp. TH2 TaxID=2775403 RepID=UPI002157D5D4|nr:hypothetical protein [Rhizobium sp. TH2]UVC11231.1 hypothetical protein IHQ71_12010 [Rhizobium sp. TH2]
MQRIALALMIGMLSTAAIAQEEVPSLTSGASMGQLIAQGYEIKAAVPNGKSFVVFLQKDSTGYACQMTTLSRAVCGKIN